MTFAIAPTDNDWFYTLRRESLGDVVNFWTPTPWNVRSLRLGEPWYFMLKNPIRKIGGYGLFREYRDMAASQAWHQYGLANGVYNFDELVERTRKYARKHVKNLSPSSDPVIGCIILSDPMLFDDEDFFVPEDYGYEFSKNIVKFKTYEGDGISFTLTTENLRATFELLEPAGSDKRRVSVKDRVGQPTFRRMVLKAYNNCCPISGTRVVEVLEAAHIQPYVDARSNHVQNGICLRSDLHRLFAFVWWLAESSRGSLRVTRSCTAEG